MIIYIVNNILDMKRGARRIEPTLHHCIQAAGPYKDMLCVHCPKSREQFFSHKRDVTIKTTTGKK